MRTPLARPMRTWPPAHRRGEFSSSQRVKISRSFARSDGWFHHRESKENDMTTTTITDPKRRTVQADISPKETLSPDELRKINAYWRACCYLAAGMIYLRSN